MSSLDQLYGKRKNFATHGTFEGKDPTNNFPNKVASFIDDVTDDNFLELSESGLEQLARSARQKASAKGGFVVFAHYSINEQSYLLVAMVRRDSGLNINDKKELVHSPQIDLSKLHQAARVNIELYMQYCSDEEDDDKHTYLSFVSPVSNREVTGYFIDALDCVDGLPPAKATKNAIEGVKAFFENDDVLRPYVKQAGDALIKYLENRNGQPATLDDIEKVIRAAAPDNIVIQNKFDGFVEYANGDDVKIPNEFSVSSSSLNKMIFKKVESISSNWDAKFRLRSIGLTPGSEIYLDEQSERIVLKSTLEQINELKELIKR